MMVRNIKWKVLFLSNLINCFACGFVGTKKKPHIYVNLIANDKGSGILNKFYK
jgi:hypothetical protein